MLTPAVAPLSFLVRKQPQIFHNADFRTVPPGLERRHIMRSYRCKIFAFVFGRRFQRPVIVFSFYPQNAQRIDVAFCQHFFEPVRNIADAFADHHAFVQIALQRQNIEHILDIISQIGSFIAVVRNQIQTRQSHHMVDSDRTGIAHIRPQNADKRLVAAFLELKRIKRSQHPLLSGRKIIIRRSARAAALHIKILVAPDFGAVFGNADRKVAVQPERKVAFLNFSLHHFQLAVGFKLQKLKEIDFIQMFRRKLFHAAAQRRTQRIFPVFGSLIADLALFFGNGLKNRQPVQFAGIRRLKRLKLFVIIRSLVRLEPCENIAQRLYFGVINCRIVNILLFLGKPNRLAVLVAFLIKRNFLNININRVQKQTAGRSIRTGRFRTVVQQNVQRIKPDDVAAAVGQNIHHALQIRKIADTPVPAALQRIKLDCKTEQFSLAFRIKAVALFRRNCQQRFVLAARRFDFNVVISRRQPVLQRRRQPDIRRMPFLAPFLFRKIHCQTAEISVPFRRIRHLDFAFRFVFAQNEVKTLFVNSHDIDGFRRFLPPSFFQTLQRFPDFFVVFRSVSQTLNKKAQNVVADHAGFNCAAAIRETGADSQFLRKLLQKFIHYHLPTFLSQNKVPTMPEPISPPPPQHRLPQTCRSCPIINSIYRIF